MIDETSDKSVDDDDGWSRLIFRSPNRYCAIALLKFGN